MSKVAGCLVWTRYCDQPIIVDDVVDWLVLAASLEVVGPPGLLLAEALDLLGPMVLLVDSEQQQCLSHAPTLR